MHPSTVISLVNLNHKFYSEFGGAFSMTRHHIQPGVARVLEQLAEHPSGQWLDLGCGNGVLAAEWLKRERQGLYLGVDFSLPLLEAALTVQAQTPREEVSDREKLEVRFIQADLSQADWGAQLPVQCFDGILAFAMLHHLPGKDLRCRLLRQVRALLSPGGWFIHSEWQFQNSPRLLARQQPWEAAGLHPEDVDPGDTLLDWRFALPGQADKVGLRYVHCFSAEELAHLAAETGFEIYSEFNSDGKEGNLALYQTWKAI